MSKRTATWLRVSAAPRRPEYECLQGQGVRPDQTHVIVNHLYHKCLRAEIYISKACPMPSYTLARFAFAVPFPFADCAFPFPFPLFPALEVPFASLLMPSLPSS